MTGVLQKIGNWFKEEYKTENQDFKQITINCLILGGLLALSMLWIGFSYITLIVALFFALTKWNGRNIYYIVFLLPLITIFKAKRAHFYYLAYVIAAVCLVLAVKLIVDVFKNKTKKINWPFTILTGVLALYFILRANFSNISMLLSLLLGLGLLFVCYYYRKDLNFKEIILLFTLGMLFTTIIGLIFYNNARLLSFIDLFSVYSRRRFQGATSNVNIYACELMLALGGLIVLKLRKQIGYTIYPAIILFSGCLMFTYSKTAMIMSMVAIALFIIFDVAYSLKNKKALLKSLISVVAIIGSLSLLCVTFNTQYRICRTRFVSSIDVVIPEPNSPSGGSGVNSGLDSSVNKPQTEKPTVKVDYTELTTGRFDIWKTYMNEITKSPKSILFGYGVGHEVDSGWIMYTGTSTHNTFIQALYYSGIVGFGLMLALLISSIEWKKFKIKDYSLCGIIMFIITGLFLMGLDFFSFRLGVYLIIAIYAMFNIQKQTDQENKPNNTNKENSKMKILNLLASDRYSGAENVVCQLIDMFGDEYEFAYCSPDGQIRESLKERNVNFLPINKKSITEVKRVIKEFKPDVIHAHDLMAIALAYFASGDVPIVAHIHNNNPKFRKVSFRSLLFKYIATKKKVKHVYWVSNSCINDFVFKENKKIAEKSTILNNIINCEKLAQKAEQAELTQGTDLVYIGRLSYQKAPHRLVEIMSLVTKKMPEVKLSVIGDGDLRENCENLAKELNVQDNIIFYGFQSNGYKVLENSKIFLLTSLFEGNPMCVLEAQSFGLPIVTTTIDELRTLVKEGETGFMYDTNEQAAEIIIKLLQDKKAYKTMKDNVKAFSAKYNDMETYKQAIRKVYNA